MGYSLAEDWKEACAMSLSRKSSNAKTRGSDMRELLRSFQSPIPIRSFALTVILVLLTFYTLYFARDFFLPVLLAFLLHFLLAPMVRGLKQIHIPEPLGAGIIILAFLGAAFYGIYRLAGPAGEWIDKAPQSLNQMQWKLRSLAGPVEEVQKTTEQIEKMATLGEGGNRPSVEVKKPGLQEIVLSRTQGFFFWGSVTVIFLYFLLASGDLFLLKVVRVLPTLEDKKWAVEIFRRIEQDVSIYLFTQTLVNIGLAIAIGFAMFLLGMPNPALWGVMAGFLNYIPYLGALMGIIIVTITAILSFEDIGAIALVPCAYFFINLVEAYWITPMVMGRRFSLNPVAIFLWLIFWGWVWGIIGALLAVPLLAIFKIICDHFKSLGVVGEFLSAESARPLDNEWSEGSN